MHSEKSIGILLHPSSLPGTPFCGTFGSKAREWIKHLAANGISVWQFLPLAPTDSLGSPYSSPSSFAYNPWFLDADDLVSEGYISSLSLKELNSKEQFNSTILDRELAEKRSQKLGLLLANSWFDQLKERHLEFQTWCSKQFWLEDHAVFMELRKQYENQPWWEWPKEFASNNKDALLHWRVKYSKNLLQHKLLQWHLDRQWQSLRKLAGERGVILFGDLPFYVSRDSADVWSQPSLFSIFSDGEMYLQSGVPPDYFSSTGQLWGNPVYRWKRHKLTNFKWWRKRFLRHLDQMDLLRLDHFRALKGYWAVSARDETAEHGNWLPSPGIEILNWFKKDYGEKLPLIAEDLGIITTDVEELRDYFDLPGMKILQFAFDGNSDNPYLPENIKGSNWVVYTGTHDNQTTCSWWENLSEEKKNNVSQRIKENTDQPCWKLIEMGMATEAKIFIAPIQDLLCLNDDHRLNKPGTIEGNWLWRLSRFDSNFFDSLIKFGKLAVAYQRNLI